MKVKILLLIVLLVMLSTTTVYAQGPQPADPPIEDTYVIPDCSRLLLREWLLARRAAMLATGDVLEAMSEGTYPFEKGLVLMEEHIFIIFSYPRPHCADELMNWTWFMYVTTNQSIACVVNEFFCASYASARIDLFKYMQTILATPLYQYAGIDTTTDKFLYEMRPPTWTEAWQEELEAERKLESRSNDIQS